VAADAGWIIQGPSNQTAGNNICSAIDMSPDGGSPVPKGAWILDKLRAGFLSGPFFDCAKIKDFFILKELSFPHYFDLKPRGFYFLMQKFPLSLFVSRLRSFLSSG
jgi:hypothetical protein